MGEWVSESGGPSMFVFSPTHCHSLTHCQSVSQSSFLENSPPTHPPTQDSHQTHTPTHTHSLTHSQSCSRPSHERTPCIELDSLIPICRYIMKVFCSLNSHDFQWNSISTYRNTIILWQWLTASHQKPHSGVVVCELRAES